MLRGSRPGERRGGRKRHTPNRRTILTDRILAAGLDHPIASRRVLLLKLLKDQKLPADIRTAIAPKCFPAKRGAAAKADSAETSGGSYKPLLDPAIRNLNLQTLDAFFGIVQDVTADPKARRKAALKIAELLLPKSPERAKAITDEYGFKVNPNLARQYRDIELEMRSMDGPTRVIPANAERRKKLQAGAEAIRERLYGPCPSVYGYNEASRDYVRLYKLKNLRDDEIALTEEQDAEEAHLRVRLDVFRNGPEEIARKRCKVLEGHESRFKQSQLFGEFHAPPLSRKAKSTLRLLRWLYPRPIPDHSKRIYGSRPDDDELERIYCDSYHPFRDELPAAEGNFYPKDSKLGPPSAAAGPSVQTEGEHAVDPSRGFTSAKIWAIADSAAERREGNDAQSQSC